MCFQICCRRGWTSLEPLRSVLPPIIVLLKNGSQGHSATCSSLHWLKMDPSVLTALKVRAAPTLWLSRLLSSRDTCRGPWQRQCRMPTASVHRLPHPQLPFSETPAASGSLFPALPAAGAAPGSLPCGKSCFPVVPAKSQDCISLDDKDHMLTHVILAWLG